ncbi:MAG: hypothetical protein WCC60_08645, partial [Ilumatobacteraceae bacterium]
MDLSTGLNVTNPRRAARAAAIAIFGVGMALSAARVVGSVVEPLFFIPVLSAVLVGWLGSRLGPGSRLLLQLASFAGAGLLVAYGADGTGADLRKGLIDGPRQVLTTRWPSPHWPTVFVALAAVVYLAVAAGVELAMRPRWRGFPAVPCLLGMVSLIAV